MRTINFRGSAIDVQLNIVVYCYSQRDVDIMGSTSSTATFTSHSLLAWRTAYEEKDNYETIGYQRKDSLSLYIDFELDNQTVAISTGDTIDVLDLSRKYRVQRVKHARFGQKTFGCVVDLKEMQDR